MRERDVAVLKLTRRSARVKAQPETVRERARHSCGQTQRERERNGGGGRERERERGREGGAQGNTRWLLVSTLHG